MSEPSDINIQANGIRQHGIEWRGRDGAHLVLLLHGCGSNCWNWYPLGKRLAERFGDRVHVVALDHRGCGDSERPSTGYTPDVCAQDVLAVREQLTDRPATLIGHSRGGWMGAYIAGRFPDEVAGLVLVDPARMVWPSLEAADAFYERVGRGLGPFDTFDDAIANAKRAHPLAVWSEDRLRGLRFGLREEGGKLVGKLPREVLAQLRAARVDSDEVGPYLANVTAPTLLLVASTSDERRQGEKLAYGSGIPGTEVRFFHTSHYMHVDAPDDIAATVGDFLARRVDALAVAGA
ncbi:alpha/beta hydrolase [Phytohabitans sp. ZYX-F-186]|uniref:Alpha/beta hydrolase n=1 Tax=Phytohabitans maris TaxID=3071409 RepID=A0ABU0ZPD8_9ACTN|nr:alpha/beta hydrolase [Phytohabitans sp. ZYX-F-186]MDQ7908911.1 alpha/beta hydrolase [Phytohabitans sp. ZYX-F-186]